MVPVEFRSGHYKPYPVPDPAFLVLQNLLTVVVPEPVFAQNPEQEKTTPFTILPEVRNVSEYHFLMRLTASLAGDWITGINIQISRRKS